jgi:ribonuclease BN (tRNA processing enzyme)
VELIVLGAGPAYTDRPGATGAAYLLRSGETTLLLDLGQGSFPALASRLEPSTLDAVVVSHLHPDHFIDLVPLRHYLRYQFDEPRRVAVHAPAGIDARIDALHGEPGFCQAAFDMHVLAPGERRIGEFTVEGRRVAHTDNSFAFRVSADAAEPALVYSGDCGRWQDLVPLVHEGDVLLVEVSFGAGPVSPGAMHLGAQDVVRLATETRPSRVLLTHLQMGFSADETVRVVREGFSGPTTLVEPGFTTRVNAPAD